MRRARAWSLHLAVVGLSLTWFGCGGSVPDPASDTAAAPEAVPPADGVVSAKASPDAETVAKGDETATEAPAAAPASATPAAVKPAPAKAETTAAEEPAAPAAKGDASGTAELLNLANTSAAPADVAKADAATKGESAGPGGGPGMQASMRPGGMPAGYPGAPGAPGGANPAMSPNGMPNMPGMPGMPPGPGAGYPGGPEGSGAMPGGGGNDNGPPSFQDPLHATAAFLKAVKAKDRDRIVEATALRAGQAQETGTETMRKLFATILDQSISDESLNDLFKALDGYQIVDTNTPKSTGRFGVILGKPNQKAGQYRRTITLRKEAKGWKVVDIGGQAELEATVMPSNRANGRMPAGKRR